MTRRSSPLPGATESDQPAALFTEVHAIFREFVQDHAPAARPEGLFETLLGAYSDADKEMLVQRIRDFITSDGDRLRRVMGEHAAGSENYVERHDWLYMEPEVLLVADLARQPRRLASVLQNTDFDRIVSGMIDELKAP